MTEYSWRVGWFEENRRKYRYYKTDYRALKKHIENLSKYGWLLSGCSLCFKVKGYFSYAQVGGNDSLLGLTYGTSFLGKSKEYWKSLMLKIRDEVSSPFKEKVDNEPGV